MMRKILIFAALCLVYSSSYGLKPSSVQYDVCVYGETSAGVAAAVQAARMGKKVVLISKNRHVGGTTTSGLTATDINRHTVIGGLAREFYQRIYKYYSIPAAWRVQNREEFFVKSRKRTFTGKSDPLKMQWVYESHVAENIFRDMLLEAGVHVVFEERLDLKKGVQKKGNTIQSIRMESGSTYTATVFIDATYSGDLMALAGVSYAVGRDDNSTYNEKYNGIRYNGFYGNEERSIDPYIVPGDPSSGVLPFISDGRIGEEGTADKRLQAFCYRLTLTDVDENKIEIKKPANYDPLWFEYMVRYIQLNPELKLQKIITLTPMPNRKTDTNHLDFVGANYDWPEGDYETRAEIEQMHKDFALGMLWTLGNDPRVPKHIREEMLDWGLAKDEFVDSENFPYQIYVRESRRMISDYVMTEHNCFREEITEHPVGLATYPMDCHYVSRVVDEKGNLLREGTFMTHTSIYPIAYEAIRPKEKECDNLLVPVCLSSSHSAFGSIRMEPVYMVLGQSAGTAAALSIEDDCSVQDLSYSKLKSRLLEDNQILYRHEN